MEYEVRILRENDEGLGIAKVDGVTVFVKNAIQGELVKIKITKKNKNYFEAITTSIIESSIFRDEPKCEYYDICGGCNIMHMCYEKQLEFKLNRVNHIFEKLYKPVNIEQIEFSSQYYYRNKITLRVNEEKLGLYSARTNSLFDCEKCIISSKVLNDVILILRNFIFENRKHGISEIIIRECDNDVMISLDKISDNIKKILIDYIKKFSFIKSVYVGNRILYGNKVLCKTLNELSFNVSSKSFFQVNKFVTSKLYDYVLSNVNDCENVLDLYCGTGTITLLLSQKCKNVIGIEVVEDAVKNAIENSKNNNIHNVKFLNGKVEDLIDKIELKNIDTIVLDPPRSGSDKKTLNSIMKINPQKIIYVSCNPVTLVRDLKVLDNKYDIEHIKLFDMFPNTYHVEAACIMVRK